MGTIIKKCDNLHQGQDSQLEKETKKPMILGKRDNELQAILSNSAPPVYCSLFLKAIQLIRYIKL